MRIKDSRWAYGIANVVVFAGAGVLFAFEEATPRGDRWTGDLWLSLIFALVVMALSYVLWCRVQRSRKWRSSARATKGHRGPT